MSATTFRRVWLFLRIVWRDGYGGTVSAADAWAVAKLVHP